MKNAVPGSGVSEADSDTGHLGAAGETLGDKRGNRAISEGNQIGNTIE